jgi:drug/metabolite transporter (DMT)-like permease
VETIDRRTAWLGIAIGFVLVFDASSGGGYGFGSGLETWELTVYLGGLVCLVVASTLIVAALTPVSTTKLLLEQRERFVFFALVLFVLALIAIVTLSADTAIEAHRHPQTLGG